MMQLIAAKYFLSMEPSSSLGPVGQNYFLENGAMIVENGTILEVGLYDQLKASYPKAVEENYRHHVLMPGLINAHTHLDLGGHKNFPFDPVRTMTAEVHFIDWFLSCMDYKQNAKQELLRESIQEGLASSLEAGTTCVGDMGSFEGIFQVLHEIGLRAVVFPEVVNYDRSVTQDLYESALGLAEKYHDENTELIRVGLAPYAPFTVSRQILKIIASYCRSTSTPLMMHVAESFSEMEFFYNSTGDIATRFFPKVGWGQDLPPPFHKTPLAYLDEIGFLKAGPVLAGCVQTTPEDLDRIAAAQAKVVLCPRANHYLKLGQPRLEGLVKRNIPVALATDGMPSNTNLSLWDEMRFAYETLIFGKSTSVSPLDLIRMVTLDAARVLGLEKTVGSLAAGKKADYVLVSLGDDEAPSDLALHLLQNTKTYHVKKVVVAGKTLKDSH